MFIFSKNTKNKKGFSLVESIVVISITLFFVSALMYAYNIYLKIALRNVYMIKASFLAEEGVEAVKFIRDSSWTSNIASLNTTSFYYLSFLGSNWSVSTNSSMIDGKFERKFKVESVKRDGNNNISSSGTDDPNTKKINMYIAWNNGEGTTTKTVSSYITNFLSN